MLISRELSRIQGNHSSDGLRAHLCCLRKTMDPIFAAASIVGLVGAAAKVTESHFRFI